MRLAAANAAPSRRLAATGAVLSIAAALCVAGCGTESYERTSTGSTVYLDELSDAAKAAAREQIVRALSHGIGVYTLGVGDEVVVYFHVDRRPARQAYRIAAGDSLRLDFLGDTTHSGTVQVQPDGRISLPLIGAVKAAGATPDALARQLEARYSSVLTEPKITINVTETHTPLEDFITVVGSSGAGRSLPVKVAPDGTISLPLLPPLKAFGRPLKSLQQEIDADYRAKGLEVTVSLVPRTLHSNVTLVVGEVSQPGQIELSQPTTVLMAVAQVGGALKTGAMNAVRLYSIGDDGVQHVRVVNLNDEMSNLTLEADTIVPPNSIIYVPPTGLATAGRFMDAVVRDILQFQGMGLGAGFVIAPANQQNNQILNIPTGH